MKLCWKLFYDPVHIGKSIKAEDDEMTGACISYKGNKKCIKNSAKKN
jgi:hypothetical protein